MNKSSYGLLQVDLTETSVVKEVRHLYERVLETSRSVFHEMVKLYFPFANIEDIGYCYARIFKASKSSKCYKKFKRLSNGNIGELNYNNYYMALLKHKIRKSFPVWYFRVEINEEVPKVESEATK